MELFETLDKPALRPLPQMPFNFARWAGKHRVPIDYHVPIDGHFYSVPHRLVGGQVEARVGADAVEFWTDGTKVATHPRSIERGGQTTAREHQPEAHQAQADRNPTAMREWAETIGPNLLAVVAQLLNRSKPMLAMPACESVKKMVVQYGAPAVERAATRAVALRSMTPSALLGFLRNERTRAKVSPPNRLLRSASQGTSPLV